MQHYTFTPIATNLKPGAPLAGPAMAELMARFDGHEGARQASSACSSIRRRQGPPDRRPIRLCNQTENSGALLHIPLRGPRDTVVAVKERCDFKQRLRLTSADYLQSRQAIICAADWRIGPRHASKPPTPRQRRFRGSLFNHTCGKVKRLWRAMAFSAACRGRLPEPSPDRVENGRWK